MGLLRPLLMNNCGGPAALMTSLIQLPLPASVSAATEKHGMFITARGHLSLCLVSKKPNNDFNLPSERLIRLIHLSVLPAAERWRLIYDAMSGAAAVSKQSGLERKRRGNSF